MQKYFPARNVMQLLPNVRSMLRRNHCLLLMDLGIDMTPQERQLLIDHTEQNAYEFCKTLFVLLMRFNREEICNYLDGMKHLIIDGKTPTDHSGDCP